MDAALLLERLRRLCDERTWLVIQGRLEGRTLAEIGAGLVVGAERVRQIVEGAWLRLAVAC